MLLVVSGLMMRSFLGLLNIDAGFDSTNLLTDAAASVDRSGARSRATESLPARSAYRRGGCARCARHGNSCAAPMQDVLRHADAAGQQALVDLANRDGGFYKVVSPSYFSALGIADQGRLLADTDTSNSPPALVANERLANRFFPTRTQSVNAFDPEDRPWEDRAR